MAYPLQERLFEGNEKQSCARVRAGTGTCTGARSIAPLAGPGLCAAPPRSGNAAAAPACCWIGGSKAAGASCPSAFQPPGLLCAR